MAQKKAHEVEAFLRRPTEGVAVVLLYGPDRGLVSERAGAFAAGTGLPLDDPFSVVRLDAGEAETDGRLVDEAQTVPMFSSRRLLWIRNASGTKSFADDIRMLSASPPRDTLILIEAGDLRKGAPLRSVVEASPIAMALPCYADADRSIDAVIDEELGKAGLAISMEAREELRRNLGGDRLATRGEIAKLALYAHGQREVTIGDVHALTGDVSAISVEEIVDAALDGRINDFDGAFARFSVSGNQSFLVLAAAIRQLQSLHVMRFAIEDGRSAAAVVTAAKPPVFYARRRLVERALNRWPTDALQRALSRLHNAVLATRQQPELAQELSRHALLAIAVEARRL